MSAPRRGIGGEQRRSLTRRGVRIVRLARYVLEDAAGLAADVAYAIRDWGRVGALKRAARRRVSGNPGHKNN